MIFATMVITRLLDFSILTTFFLQGVVDVHKETIAKSMAPITIPYIQHVSVPLVFKNSANVFFQILLLTHESIKPFGCRTRHESLAVCTLGYDEVFYHKYSCNR